MDTTGPRFHNTEALASLIKLKSTGHPRHLLNEWLKRLSREEIQLLQYYHAAKETPDEGDPFLELGLEID